MNADSNSVDFIQKYSEWRAISSLVKALKFKKFNDFLFAVFPGGFLPSVSYTTEMIKTGSRGRLTVDSMQNIGVSPFFFLSCCHSCPRVRSHADKHTKTYQPHYARTLREWRLRFLAHFDRDIRPALRDEHPEMSEKDVEVFKRKWICECTCFLL